METAVIQDGIVTGTEAAEIEAAEIERLQEELRRQQEIYLRALADFDNYRRRVERERASAARAGKRDLLLSLLDILDGFDRALAQVKELTLSGDASRPVVDGLRALHRKLLSLLEAQGVKPLKTLGEAFNPELHEAVGAVETGDYEPGAVADELQRGYLWGDELLRPARVRVAQ